VVGANTRSVTIFLKYLKQITHDGPRKLFQELFEYYKKLIWQIGSGVILSVQSKQNVKSKGQIVQSKLGK
jgi:hypothetical protein